MKILISLFFALLFITFGVQYFSNGSASAAMEEGTALVAIKTPESYSQNAQIGQRLFEAKCADCHGPNAVGQAGVAPPLIHIIYEPNHHGDESFQRAVALGVRAHHWKFGNMPAVAGLTRAEVKFIIAYVRELQRHNGIF
tara:strand:- start:28 stop:447 length:420 start_codon:yes stop_codon:yes gene_type:complete